MANLGKEAFTASVLCPFYRDHYAGKDYSGKKTEAKEELKRESLLYVKCEGFASGSFVRLCFKQKEKLLSYMERVCCGPWQRCPYARVAGVKYKKRE